MAFVATVAGLRETQRMPRFDCRTAPAVTMLALPYGFLGVWLWKHQSAAAADCYLAADLAILLLLMSIATTWRRFLLLNIPLFVVSTIFAAYVAVDGILPGDTIAYVLATTSWEEVVGFFGLPQGQRLLVACIVSWGAYVWLAYRASSLKIAAGRPLAARACGIASLAVLIAYGVRAPEELFAGLSVTPLAGSGMFVAGPLAAANVQVHGTQVRKRPYSARRVAATEVHILIVGESSRRDSWSLYGYTRSTTPYLESISDELILFRHAETDSNVTVLAVPMLLTGIGPESYDVGSVRGNIIDLAKEAGYHTSWLVNQDAHVSNLVGMDADESIYPHLKTEMATRSLPPDGTLLADLSVQLSRKGLPLFIGLHVDGSHWAYFDRYPREFERFGSGAGLTFASLSESGGDRRMLDAYDNSILYTDWFLQQVIESARGLDVATTVTYLSDHGESLHALDGRFGHGWPEYEASEFDIPAFVWVNAAYRRAHPEKVRALAANASKEIRTHDFFFGVADLMGIGWPGFSPQRSFASPEFLPDTGDRHIAGGKLVARRN